MDIIKRIPLKDRNGLEWKNKNKTNPREQIKRKILKRKTKDKKLQTEEKQWKQRGEK